MENEHQQKIQNLVKVSSILVEAEKNEWLELMDLMNDRQLLELERILQDSGNNQKAVVAKEGEKPSQVQSLKSKPIETQPVKNPATSPFSHILNFPKAPGAQPLPPIKPLPIVQAKVESRIVEPKKQSPFLAKLKNIFTEKELPAPHQGALSDHSVVKDLPVKAKPVPPKPQPHHLKLKEQLKKPVEEAPKPKLPEPVKKPVEEPVLPKAPQQPEPKKPENVTINVFLNDQTKQGQGLGVAQAQSALEQVSAAGLPTGGKPDELSQQIAESMSAAVPPQAKQSVPSKSTPARPSDPEVANNHAKSGWGQTEEGLINSNRNKENVKAAVAAAVSTVAYGLNFPEGSSAEALKSRLTGTSQQSIGGKAAPAPAGTKIVLQEKPGDNIKLETLADIDVLKPDDLKQHATGTMFRKLQKLVSVNGLHEVVRHMEISPLYKAYIETGVALLKEDANRKSAPLTSSDFERFVDLLIMMRSKS